jgi:hypothetical protein
MPVLLLESRFLKMSFPHNNDPIVLNDVIYCFLYRRFIVPFTIQEIQKKKKKQWFLSETKILHLHALVIKQEKE